MSAEPVEEMLPGTTPGGAKAITADLMARLARYYTPPGDLYPGGALVTEVGWNSTGGRRRCDAIYVGFTGTSGRLMVGHEVKASRSDWLKELSDRTKADEWESQCHAWNVVAAPGVVHRDELPDGWGLMTPGRTRVKLTVEVAPRTWPERQPSWDAVRSVMARWDTLRAQAIAEARTKADADHREKVASLAEHWRQQIEEARVGTEAEQILSALCTALGVEQIEQGRTWGRNRLGVEDIAPALAAWLAAGRDLRMAANRMLNHWGTSIREARLQLDLAEAALKQVQALADPEGGRS